jgi:hypothetical protein
MNLNAEASTDNSILILKTRLDAPGLAFVSYVSLSILSVVEHFHVLQ